MPCLQATFNRVNFCIKKSVASNKPTQIFYTEINPVNVATCA